MNSLAIGRWMYFLKSLFFRFCLILGFFGGIFGSVWSDAEEVSSDIVQAVQKDLDSSLTQSLKSLPVQDRGRIKPFDTFARESVYHIMGKKNSQSVHLLMTWLLVPEYWDQQSLIRIQKAQVKKSLNLEPSRSHFSYTELLKNKDFKREVEELHSRKKQKETLSTYFKAIEKLESQVSLYHAIKVGTLPFWLPVFDQDKWLSIVEMPSTQQKRFIEVLRSYSDFVLKSKNQLFKKSIQDWKKLSKNQVNHKKIQAEIQYNSLQPFRWSWVLYFFSLLLFCVGVLSFKYSHLLFLVPLASAFILHSYGIILRCYIMSRPPVSNMFETLLWVPWSALVIALVFSLLQKTRFPLMLGAVSAFFCLFLSDTSSILDGRLEPLEAVLRSNFWLSTHVLIITMSYSAFFLAFILSDFLIFQFLFGKLKPQKIYYGFLYRLLQIGILLLALGTILGAIWADYSWGRFWGWDPKEVWALVSLLGYLALVHARLQGWVREFGLVIGSVCCFFFIIMAWYGVNFVLGKGLHSYGFGQGGLSYVLFFIFLHLILVWGAWRKKDRK